MIKYGMTVNNRTIDGSKEDEIVAMQHDIEKENDDDEKQEASVNAEFESMDGSIPHLMNESNAFHDNLNKFKVQIEADHNQTKKRKLSGLDFHDAEDTVHDVEETWDEDPWWQTEYVTYSHEEHNGVGDYIVDCFIAAGAFGEVYEATRCETNEKVALKMIAKDKVSSDKAFEDFTSELDVMYDMDHPNIIAYKGVIETPDNFFIVMELGHQDAFNFWQGYNFQLPQETVREIMAGVLMGVTDMHEKGYAHLDLKLLNFILVTNASDPMEIDRSHIKICDLGMSKHGRPGGPVPVFQVCGTPEYTAPEMCGRNIWIDGRQADIWSMGVVFAQLMGVQPEEWRDVMRLFHPKSIPQFHRRMKACLEDLQTECPPHCPPDVHELICQMLQYHPQFRPSAREVLEHSWFRTGT